MTSNVKYQCNAATKCGLQCTRQCDSEKCWQHKDKGDPEKIPDILLKKFPPSKYYIVPTSDKEYGTLYMIESVYNETHAIDTFGDWYDKDGNFVRNLKSEMDIENLQKKFPNAQIYPYIHKKLGLVYVINDGRVGATNYYDSNGNFIFSVPVIPKGMMSKSQLQWLRDIGKWLYLKE
jgi:hypothetical protein